MLIIEELAKDFHSIMLIRKVLQKFKMLCNSFKMQNIRCQECTILPPISIFQIKIHFPGVFLWFFGQYKKNYDYFSNELLLIKNLDN